MQKRDKPDDIEFGLFVKIPDGTGGHRKAYVLVPEEVYVEWYRASNRLKYLFRLDRQHNVLSLDAIDFEAAWLSAFDGGKSDPDAEAHIDALIDQLLVALTGLDESDFALVEALFFECVSMREYGRRIGVTHRTVSKRRARILSHLKSEIERLDREGSGE